MADRTVTTRLKLSVTDWKAGSSTVKHDLKDLNRQFTESAGFAAGFRKKLEDAVKQLPKIEIDANSTPAEVAMAKLRDELEKLSQKTIGVDIDAGDAFAEMSRIKAELATLEDGASFEVRAGIRQATEGLALVEDEVRRLDGRTAHVRVDVDTGGAIPKLAGFADSVGGALAAGVRTTAGPALLGALGGVAVAVGPAIGAAMGGAIVAGIGARLAVLGASSQFIIQEIDKSWSAVEKKRVEAANKQAKELQAQFKELGRDITLAFQESSRPMLSVLDEVRVQARDVAKDVGPNLSAGFDQARVPMERFVRDLGAGLKDLGNSIPSLMDGFGDVISEIDIKGFLSDLGTEFDKLGRVVSENRGAIGAVLNSLLAAIPLAIGGLSKVIEFFGSMGLASVRTAATISEHMSGSVRVISGVGTRVLEVTRAIGQALSNVPGTEELGRKIVAGADAGIRKLQEFSKQADEASRAVRLKADIVELQQGIDRALTLLDDPNLSKERRAKIGAEIDRLLRAKGEALLALGDPKLIAEYQSKIATDISSLQSRLADARRELADPNLTKERKSRLNAEISQLKEAVARAKAALNSINDKTVTITVKVNKDGSVNLPGNLKASPLETGGIVQYAAGGVHAFAGGGRMSPKPHIATGPTILFGEGSDDEAFIPYDMKYRDRATALLGQVANDFGLQLNNKTAAQGLSELSVTLDDSGVKISDRLTGVMGSLEKTMGQAGSLTSSITNVGASADRLNDAWQAGSDSMTNSLAEFGAITADNFTLATESVDGLTVSVQDLVGIIQSGIMSGGKGGSKKGPNTAKTALNAAKNTLESMGLKLPNGPKGGMVEGHSAGDFVSNWSASLTQGAPVNSSRVSAPQQVPASRPYTPGASGGGGGGAPTPGGGGSGAGAVVVQGDLVVKDRGDADYMAEKLYFKQTSRG